MESIKINRLNKEIKLGNVIYRPYKVGELPDSFGYIFNEIEDKNGVSKWFNYKGLTYLRK
tara:strand:- start:275 stop:454 length:180 start_codon:yes stop_codon:yes gene_type:complete